MVLELSPFKIRTGRFKKKKKENFELFKTLHNATSESDHITMFVYVFMHTKFLTFNLKTT